VKAYRSVANLLADPEIDLIDICSPTATHSEIAIAALKAGKHVLCEKPLARTSEEARKIVAAAAEAKTYLMPAMCLRFWPEWAWLREAIQNETFGKVLGARFRRVAEPPGWGEKHFPDGALSGGALLDLHIHDADFVRYCFGSPRSVFSNGYTKHSGAIDHVVTQYQVASGAIVHAEGSWAMAPGFGFEMSYTVNFERATADYNITKGADALRLCEPGQPPRTVVCAGPDGYVRQLLHLVESIASGIPPSVVTPEDGLRSVELCEAEEQSIHSGQVVVLS
jgi:predicted dehydrogenase